MPRFDVLPGSRACLQIAALAVIAIGATGCEDSARFDSNPFGTNSRTQRQEVTGSVNASPVTQGGAVESRPLPAPSQPATVPASGVSYGAQGLGAYRPGPQSADVTGSVAARPAPQPVAQASPQPAATGGWTWDGGSAIVVGQGETIETIARKYGVPQAAILQVNGITDPAAVRPGQRVIIPRYSATATTTRHTAAASPAPAPAPTLAKPAAHDGTHVIAPGETLIGIAKRYGVTQVALAQANNIQPYAKINIGDRLVIPGARVAARQAPAPQITQPNTVPSQRIATGPSQNVRMATQVPTPDPVTKTAEPAGGVPSFRWPVHGRVIAGFGSKTNGTPNDGINVAVPEGTPIKAADDGVVAYAGSELKGYGNLVLIHHANGFVSAYAHASELTVKRGDTIKRGQVIGRAGQTGNVTSPQLHFEIRKGSTPVDPTQYLGGA